MRATSRSQKHDMAGGLLGTAFGGFAWMMIVGFAIGSPASSALGMTVVAVAGFVIVVRDLMRMKEQNPNG